MTAGAEVVCSEIEIEKCVVSGLNQSGVNAVGIVDCNVNGNVGNGDCTFVFVNGGIEVSDGDKVDRFEKEELGIEKEGCMVSNGSTNGVVYEVKTVKDGSTVDFPVVKVSNGVAQDANGGYLYKVSDLADEVDQFKKEEIGVEKEGMHVGLLVSKTNGIVHEFTTECVDEVKAVKKDVNFENGSTVDPPMVLVTNGIAQFANGHVDDTKDIGCGLTFCIESTLSTIESGKPSEDLGNQGTVDEQEFCGSPMKERKVSVDRSDSIGMEMSEEHQELLVINSEVDVEVEPNHACSAIKADNKKAEGTEICSGIVSEDSGHVLSEKVDALANGQVENLEMGDTQIFGTEANGSSEKLLKVTESVEMEVSTEERNEVKVEDEIHESQKVVIDNVQDELNLEDNMVESVIEAEVSLEAGTEIMTVIHENASSQYGVSDCIDEPHEGLQHEASAENVETTNIMESECNSCELLVEDNGSVPNLDDLTVLEQKGETESHLGTKNKSAEGIDCGTGIENVDVFDDDDDEKETKIKDAEYVHLVTGVSSNEGMGCGNGIENVDVSDDDDDENKTDVEDADDLIVVEKKVEIEFHLGTGKISAEGMDCGTGIENVDVSDDDDDDEKESKVKDAEDVPHPVIEIMSLEGMGCGNRVGSVVFGDEVKETGVKDVHVEFVNHFIPENRSSEDRDSETGIKRVDSPDAPVGDRSTLSFSDTIVNSGAVIEFGSIGRHETILSIQNEEVEDMNGVKSDVPNSSVEGEVNDAIDVQNEEVEVLEYNFLIKIPRDENFRDQITSAQEVVEEKTCLRDSIRAKVLEKREMLRAYNEEYDAVKQDEIAARRLVKAKREEIEALQAVISRLKNAMSVEDIDKRICQVEYIIQHETICLADEKEFIREIKQLKGLRAQLASNMGTPEEIRHAIDMKDHNEECMMTLRKELDSLKAEVSKVLVVLEKIVAKYEKTISEERELQLQFRYADDVRQKAYAHLNNLKKLSYDKNQNFRQFKEDVSTAKTFLSQGDKDALHNLCANQVESFMEQWNNNDEFRKEYVNRCNMVAIRRQKALDRAPLVSDDVVPLLPGNVNEQVDRSPVSIPGEVKHVSVVLPVEQGKDASSTEIKKAGESIENVSGQKNQELKNEAVAKPTNLGSGDVAKEAEVAVVTELAEHILTKEEVELARKAEELRKEEIAGKLKEQRRLEEKAKAIEALERKKRNAEKAQLRAELRARKEVELKEKEREKRLRKKEKKTGGGDGSINGEEAAGSEGSNEAIETVVNKKKTQKPPAHFFAKQLKPKPVPPPLLNKNKRRWQQWGQPALAVLALIIVFLLANFGLFFDFKSSKFATPL